MVSPNIELLRYLKKGGEVLLFLCPKTQKTMGGVKADQGFGHEGYGTFSG